MELKDYTIEEKAKRYDEAIERARKLKENPKAKFFEEKNVHVSDYIFPELKESEDEMIRKDIISFLRSKNGYMNPDEDWDFHNRWLPWLEKQGEQILANSAKTCKNEQKPAWSAEDEKCLENAIMYCEWARDKAPDLPCYETSEKSISWLKSLKNRVQPKQEWSEEDERFYDMICGYFDDGRAMGEDEINEFLKWLWLLSKKNKRTT